MIYNSILVAGVEQNNFIVVYTVKWPPQWVVIFVYFNLHFYIFDVEVENLLLGHCKFPTDSYLAITVFIFFQ